ncbi:MAG: CusA/CzcA family heavy metal efflux RND transporter [Rikenellaceae bacterium]|jgi:CzcA family heavy metal efflux pump|nr:CusA/CzcA family heavy metal efflux RND transporter [Rikenellaceae bacterium]
MLSKIVHYSLRNMPVVITLTVVLVIAGWFVGRELEIDVFPDLTAPTVVVMTEANGMAPEEVERSITFPIETVVNGAAGVRRVRSSSQVGLSTVWVEFDWGVDQLKARQIVSEKLMSVTEQMPQGVEMPVLAPQSSLLGEIYTFGLTADSLTDARALRTLVAWTIRPQLLSLGGVAQVTYLGGEEKEYQIMPRPDRMNYYGVTLTEVIDAVEGANVNASGGVLNEFGNEYVVRGMGRAQTLSEIGALLVSRTADRSVSLSQVADLQVGSAPKIGDGAYRGTPAVIVTITKQPGINTLELTRRIEASLAQIAPTLPPDVQIHTDIFNQGEFIERAVGNVGNALLEGSVFVVIILFFFLWNFRTTIISLTAIPVSLLMTIILLKLLGGSINTMTLGGMAIAIGSLVDDAIIDVENVYKRLKENAARPKSERRPIFNVVFDASIEIRASILNATLIVIVAFMPLFFLSGMEGRMLKPLGIAYIVALFSSLIVAMTLTPVMCRLLLTSPKQLAGDSGHKGLSVWLKPYYQRSLEWVLRHQKKTLAVTGGAFLLSILLFTTFGSGFLPPFNEGQITVMAMATPGISLEESNRIGQQVEEALLTVPEIAVTSRRTGRAELAEHSLGTQVSEIDVPYTLDKRSKEEMIAEVRQKMAEIPGIVTEISQPVSHRIDAMLSGTGANIAIKIFGDDLPTLYAIGQQIKAEVSESVAGIGDLNVEQQIETPQLQIVPNRPMMAQYGVTLPGFNRAIRYGLAGQPVGEIFDGGAQFDLIMRLADRDRGSMQGIRDLYVDGFDGQPVPLSRLAEVVSTAGPNSVSRENARRKLVVSVNVAGRDVGSVVDDIARTVDEHIALPEGYRIEYGGSFESEKSASRTLMTTSLLAILVIFLLLYQEFKQVRLAVLVMLSLPFALIGGIVAVWASSGVMSIPSIIGFITLLGIATRNGILLVSRYQRLIGQGRPIDEAVRHGSADRLAPILMTALTSSLALLPMALQSTKAGNEIQSPMAIVILGGLLSSTLLTVYVIPVIYLRMKSSEAKKCKQDE